MTRLQPLLRIAPLIAGTLIAMVPMEATPFVISGLMKTNGLSAEQAGWVATACIAAVAIASMVLAPLVPRLSFRKSMLVAALVLAAGYAIWPFAGTFVPSLVIATVIGAGAGALLAGMATMIAGFPDPDRIYGMIYAATGLVFALLLYLLPVIAETISPTTMFFAVAGLVLASALPLARLPALVHDEHPVTETAGGIRWGAVAIVVVVLVISQPFYGGTYSFAERKAVEVGLTSVQAGMSLSVATLLTIAGTSAVAIIGTRWGRLVPTVTVLGLATVAYFLVLGAAAPSGYLVGILLFGFVQLGMNSYLFGLASALDRSGRVAAAIQGFSLIPYGLGPGLFGSIAGDGSLTVLAVPAVVLNVVAILLLMPVLVSLDRRRQPIDAVT